MQKWVAMLGVNGTAFEASLIHTKDWVEMWGHGGVIPNFLSTSLVKGRQKNAFRRVCGWTWKE